MADDLDDRDWRTRNINLPPPAPLPAERPQAPQQQQQQQQTQERQPPKAAARRDQPAEAKAPAARQPAPEAETAQQHDQEPSGGQSSAAAAAAAPSSGPPRIVKAADVGLQAYRPGGNVSMEERAVRQVKGILNKLTPEKFDRLLGQLLEVVTTASILQQTIALVFENAVAQPTFCAMYADLCYRLSKDLPVFPPAEGDNKPLTFARILLNTCQDEFEEAQAMRNSLAADYADPEEREAAERKVKGRTMGTVRLIGELYKKDIVSEKILTVVIKELLAAPDKAVPPEDNIEAVCEMVNIAGAKLAKTDNVVTKKSFEASLARLDKLGGERSLSARIRFVIRDVMDLKRSNWIPRREVFTAKKIDEVRAEAEAELGMISSAITIDLPTLPSQQRMQSEDVELIPRLRGEEGWGFGLKGNKSFEGSSALLGDWSQPAARAAAAEAPSTTAAAAAAAAAAPVPSRARPAGGSQLSEEVKLSKTESLLDEFVASGDKTEAVTCLQEIEDPAFMHKVVEAALNKVLASVSSREQDALCDLLVHLNQQGGLISSEHIVTGLATFTSQLEDLSLDVPAAPQLLGGFFGKAVSGGAAVLDVLPDMLEGDYGAGPKRAFTAAALKTLQAKLGDAGLAQLCHTSGIKAGDFLQPHPEFDEGEDLPAVDAWLASQGLSVVPV